MTDVECINESITTEHDKDKVKKLNSSHLRAPQKLSSGKHRRGSLSPTGISEAHASLALRRISIPTSGKDNLSVSQFSSESTGDLFKSQTSDSTKKIRKKRRKSQAQQELVLDVTALHSCRNKINSKDEKSKCSSLLSLSASPSPKLVVYGVHGSKSSLNLSHNVTYSPSPSQKSDSQNANEIRSGESSVYHSSCLYPSEECQKSDGELLGIPKTVNTQIKCNVSSLAVTPQRRHSSQDAYVLQASQRTVSPSLMRHSSTALEELHRTSLPYIPSVKTEECREVRGSIDFQAAAHKERRESELLCQPWGGVCGPVGEQNKELNDQTCRSYFGMVLCGLCFILFLWYLAMVYSRFINKAVSLDTFETRTTPEPGPVQEVVVHISAEDLRETSF